MEKYNSKDPGMNLIVCDIIKIKIIQIRAGIKYFNFFIIVIIEEKCRLYKYFIAKIKNICNCIQLAYNGYVYRMIMAKEILKEHRRVKDFR